MILHCPINELISIINSHIPHPENVLAMLLHGSRADGRAHEYSDYDVMIIQNPCSAEHITFTHDNIPYSCHFYSPELVTAENMTSHIAFFYFRSKPLFDPTGIGAQFIEVVNAHVEKTSKVSSNRQEQIEKHLNYLIQKAKDIDSQAKQSAQTNLPNKYELEIQAKKARIDCLLLSLDYMFLYHGMPDVGGKKELDILLRDDPALFDLFVQAILPGATFEDAYIWLKAIKNEPFKPNSFNVEFDGPTKIASLTATNRQGQTFYVKQLFVSYKNSQKLKHNNA